MATRAQSKLDRSAFDVVPLEKEDDDLAYWLTRSPLERLEAVETLRQTFYGYDPSTARLQRVFKIAELEGR